MYQMTASKYTGKERDTFMGVSPGIESGRLQMLWAQFQKYVWGGDAASRQITLDTCLPGNLTTNTARSEV